VAAITDFSLVQSRCDRRVVRSCRELIRPLAALAATCISLLRELNFAANSAAIGRENVSIKFPGTVSDESS